jgi:hypothetical protein
MKSSYLRASAALACALSLSACGGGGGSLQLNASVSGLTKSGLVLQNNGGNDLTVPAGATLIPFPQLINSDSDYNVTIKSGTGPSNADCVVQNGKGKAGAFNVTVFVVCTVHTHELKGTVSGLDADGLVVVNGADRQEIPRGAISFSMSRFNSAGTYVSGRVAEEAPYGVAILTQPGGRVCSVANGVGTMGTTDVNNVLITCV